MPATKVKEKIYWSGSEKFKLGADSIQQEEHFVDGRMKSPAATINFFGNVYRTNDPAEQRVIETCPEFKQGLVREVTPNQLSTAQAAEAVRTGKKTAEQAFKTEADKAADEDPGYTKAKADPESGE